MNNCTRIAFALLIVLCINLTPANAQNLVVNPSFEITSSNCGNLGGEGFFTDLTGSWDNASNNVGGDSCSSPIFFRHVIRCLLLVAPALPICLVLLWGSNIRILVQGMPALLPTKHLTNTGNTYRGVFLLHWWRAKAIVYLCTLV